MNKKKIAIIASIVVAAILLVVGVSYAYYSANVKENNKTETVIKTNELTIVYTGTEEINVEGIVPGDSFTKKFTVENTSNVPVTYNIYLEDITNEFNEDLVYVLKDEDGTVIEEEVLPSTNTSKTYLITDIEIDSNELKEYEMTIEFKYSDEDQNKLQGKSFNATLGIDTDPVKIVKVVNDKIELDKLSSGQTVTKTFSVKNLSKETQSYYIKLSDVINTYGDNLTYSLIKNGSEIISNETMPSSDTTILESQTISANSIDEYEMTIKFDGTTAALDFMIAEENDEFSADIVVNYKASDVSILCKRATELHTEVCTLTDTTICCGAVGYKNGSDITYGNLGKVGDNPVSGDAYDCDVDGDGLYGEKDTVTGKYLERFYYMTNKDIDTAVLIYYNNVSSGNINNSVGYEYNIKGSEYLGPQTAILQLPSASKWKNVKLKNTKRNITDENDNIKVSSFSYEGYNTRLVTIDEIEKACSITIGEQTPGELNNCIYLLENTWFSNINLKYGYWTENVHSESPANAWRVSGISRHVSNGSIIENAYFGVRPVIEVPLIQIEK